MNIPTPDALEIVRGEPCCSCNAAPPSDPNHIKTRGAGGKDAEWNLIPMCRRCHSLWHGMGWYSFVTCYPSVRLALERKGWTIEIAINFRPRLWHPELAVSDRNQ